jgi:hypothetical protein
MFVSSHTKSDHGVHPPEATQFIQAQAGCAESLNQRYYSGDPFSSARDEGGTCQSIIDGVNHI